MVRLALPFSATRCRPLVNRTSATPSWATRSSKNGRDYLTASSQPTPLLGIDLTNGFLFPRDDGLTPNDSQGHGAANDPNNFENFPVLTSAMSSGGMTNVAGTLKSTPNSTFRIEFFASDADPLGLPTEGQQFLGFVNTSTDSSGNASFNATLNVSVTNCRLVTSTATDPIGNTSEFSNAVPVGGSIICPPDQTVVAAASCPIASGTVVTFPMPMAVGTCGPVMCSPASGTIFPIGTTTVTCSAAGAPSCSFNVTVFSACLQDETLVGNVVLFNAQTGDFSFCCGGVTIASGRGTVTTKGCIGSIEANKGDRHVLIQWDTTANSGKGEGTAYLRLLSSNFICQITDRNMSNNTCQCSSVPPPASPEKPKKERAP